MRRRELVAALPAALSAGCTIGGDPPVPAGDEFRLTLPGHGDRTVPERYTCDGAGDSPPLRIEGVPERAESVAIVGEWLRGYTPQTIWLLWGLPAADPFELPAGLPSEGRLDSPAGARQGTNGEGTIGYRSPCHETADNQGYRFIAFALPDRLGLDPGSDRDAFDDTLNVERSTVSSTTLSVRYERFPEERTA
ncbi:YbhB/YbcL family Raf kinase inhibitor-like protein [Natronomonas sp. LN261]|jgi:phosphatidylethanolamine-binding protein (PEBP) family uncharacterized protein|uniref:YbhB/YbcL family Raf kinase inhibitor-like protein n=1 Tax=Natronomonas sp. LN261 TaxID=2750669 RepID=UPI0015EEAAE5|nr:YbhB/YbcL family Raf kinase inhibitor-like protein [Natronomonas sp. LN261]